MLPERDVYQQGLLTGPCLPNDRGVSSATLCISLSTTSTVILFGVRRVVMGENTTFVGKCSHNHLDFGLAIYTPISVCIGGEDFLISRGVEIVNLDSTECKDLMAKFIQAKPEVWNEDIGEE